MLIIDLDGFKTINDVHGHLTGDNLLRTAADVIRKALPKDAIAARLGGDEFAAAFQFDPDSPASVDLVAHYIVDRLGKPFDLAGVHTHISASLGIARSDADCASVDALLRRADIAMYAAKKLGRGRAIWFDAPWSVSFRPGTPPRPACAAASRKPSSCPSSSSRSTCPPARCMALRCWPAGSIRSGASCLRTSSSALPRNAA
jgi:diguanylate cyclase (GGDEF)-like protein